MCDLFGGSSDDSSRQMIDMQKEEAAAARAKEVARQARLTSGLARIKGAFHGTPEMVKRTFKAGASGMPTGFKLVDLPAVSAIAGRPAGTRTIPGQMVPTTGHGTGNMQEVGGRTVNTPAVTAVPGRAAGKYVQGPDGKVYKIGENVTADVATGKQVGGIQPSFFNDFKQGILDYYTPQVAEKYGEAKDETTFRLARAGTLRSSAANDAAADLFKQNLINVGDVRNKADTAAADLRSRTAAEEAKAVSQLYATENPDVAANQATAAIRNITSEDPPTTALGDIFNVAAIGGAKYMQGADNAAFAKRVGALPKPQTRTV
jgi:hypothetical protein